MTVQWKMRQNISKAQESCKRTSHKFKDGCKFGKSGKTYRGKGAKKKAQKQERVIYASGYKEGRKK